MKDIELIQDEQAAWAGRNFGYERPSYQPLLGAVEELGELAHAHLKEEQGIRTSEDHSEDKKDAIGDIVIYLMDYCNLEGFNLHALVQETWESVSKRDWKENPDNGVIGPTP